MARYAKGTEQASREGQAVQLTLRDLILAHLGEWVPRLVEAEIDEMLGRKRYERQEDQHRKQYRNSFHKEHTLTTGLGIGLKRLPQTAQAQGNRKAA